MPALEPDLRNLTEETERLAAWLGHHDAATREESASTLVRWTQQGVYDDLLAGFGDGIATALSVSVADPLRREASARVLAACVARDQQATLVLPGKVFEWSDRLLAWVDSLVGDDTLAAAPVLRTLADSRHFGAAELRVLLDLVASVAAKPSANSHERAEALAEVVAVIWTLHSTQADSAGGLSIVSDWLEELTAVTGEPHTSPGLRHLLTVCFTRASLNPGVADDRAETVLAFVEALRRIDPARLGAR